LINPRSAAETGGGPTGERFIPEAMGDSLIEAEHHVRYRFAAGAANGQRVLDAGCGVGWGSLILQGSGAAMVMGVDIAADAVEDARHRSTTIGFVQGNLEALPFYDDEFDLITCFEAIEHVSDPWRALDELSRVLVPGGTAMVSSPNPRVYPPGNPFHVHEFEPEELLAELRRRFAHARVGRHSVARLTEASVETARYSLVLATDGDIADLGGMVALVSTRQVSDLETAAERVEAERAAYLEDHARITEERQRLVSEHALAHAEAQRLVGENSALGAERADLRDRLREATARLESTTADRDRVLLLLLEAEQELARQASNPVATTLSI
jgi:2-polyprenyl-3-methyl-5-hydroxy-6-metoxy-1,4-benzoquinol methylase